MDVLIVGAGLSGLGMATKQGDKDFLVIEKADHNARHGTQVSRMRMQYTLASPQFSFDRNPDYCFPFNLNPARSSSNMIVAA
jgi:cation diffusion facilitator CzcD-associated flavoprotein CzcO